MALFMVQLTHGEDTVIEADAAGRTAAGEIVLERTDHGTSQRVQTFPPEAVTAVFRRTPAGGGGYEWIPQPPEGTWWCY